MGIYVDENVCNGCGIAEEPMCVRDCPGDLMILKENRKAMIRDNRDCWDCAACPIPIWCTRCCSGSKTSTRISRSRRGCGVARR